MAKQAAELRLRVDVPPELLGAFAALLNLLGTSGHTDVTNRMAELASGQANLDAEVRVALDGPYLVTNIKQFTNWLGEEFRPTPQMALCRCGQSSIKPFAMAPMHNRASQGSKIQRGLLTSATLTKVSSSRFLIIGESVPTRDSAPTASPRSSMLGKNHSLRQAGGDWTE